MFTLYLTEVGSTLEATSTDFQVLNRQQLCWQVPIKLIKQIALFSNCNLSRNSQNVMTSRQIPVLFIAEQGQLLVHLDNGKKTTKKYLRQQKKCRRSPNFSRAFAQSLLRAKLHNQRTLLLRFLSSHSNHVAKNAINTLALLMAYLPMAETQKALWHLETKASHLYYQALTSLLSSCFQFQQPQTSKPIAIDTLLNLGDALLSQNLYRLVTQIGLHPDFGHLHTNCTNHTPLVCDLMEQFRPPLVEELVIELVNSHQLTWDDFLPPNQKGNCLLSASGLKKFIHYWEAKLQTSVHHFVAGKMSYCRVLEWQVQEYLAYLLGDIDCYRPLLMKLQMSCHTFSSQTASF